MVASDNFEKPDRLPLTNEQIGDCLDLEVSKVYPCSDGSWITTISVDAVVVKTASIVRKEIGELVEKQPEMESFDEVADEKHRAADGYFVSKSIVEALKQGKSVNE